MIQILYLHFREPEFSWRLWSGGGWCAVAGDDGRKIYTEAWKRIQSNNIHHLFCCMWFCCWSGSGECTFFAGFAPSSSGSVGWLVRNSVLSGTLRKIKGPLSHEHVGVRMERVREERPAFLVIEWNAAQGV